jgi:hypothetical protein
MMRMTVISIPLFLISFYKYYYTATHRLGPTPAEKVGNIKKEKSVLRNSLPWKFASQERTRHARLKY